MWCRSSVNIWNISLFSWRQFFRCFFLCVLGRFSQFQLNLSLTPTDKKPPQILLLSLIAEQSIQCTLCNKILTHSVWPTVTEGTMVQLEIIRFLAKNVDWNYQPRQNLADMYCEGNPVWFIAFVKRRMISLWTWNTLNETDLPFSDLASTLNADRVSPRRTRNTKYLSPIFLQNKTKIVLFFQEEQNAELAVVKVVLVRKRSGSWAWRVLSSLSTRTF